MSLRYPLFLVLCSILLAKNYQSARYFIAFIAWVVLDTYLSFGEGPACDVRPTFVTCNLNCLLKILLTLQSAGPGLVSSDNYKSPSLLRRLVWLASSWEHPTLMTDLWMSGGPTRKLLGFWCESIVTGIVSTPVSFDKRDFSPDGSCMESFPSRPDSPYGGISRFRDQSHHR